MDKNISKIVSFGPPRWERSYYILLKHFRNTLYDDFKMRGLHFRAQIFDI